MRRFLSLTVIIIISFWNIYGQSILIGNSGFEKEAANGLPAGWSVETSGKVSLDKSVKYVGGSSLSIEHSDWAQSVIASAEVNLKVGHVYKLSAYVKTESVFSNPYDQYPTPVAGAITMESFPFTNSSPTFGATKNWQKIEMMFVATKGKDKLRFHLGYNGSAKGKVWIDEASIEEVKDISEFIPMETVRWHGPAFRYEDKGWIFVHIEGKPYQRGYQYGTLLAEEIKMFIEKLAISQNAADPKSAWENERFQTDALLLRKYEEEYLTEMKGIADGAASAGAKVFDRAIDFLDIVAINSSIDLDYIESALRVTPNPLTGKSFLADEDDLTVQERLHKCSSFLANNSATKDGRIVFGQIFMWGGYTGYHWNVIVDIIPSEGNRLVYQTYPGGIHSGADFYMNSVGIMIGETTVAQTPFNPDGIPQSNRIRKAAQYAKSIDDVVKIMTEKNNGMYTNDWLIGDVKKNEIAILLLGTYKWKLWRSSKNEWYGGAKDFYWSNNNNKDAEVRKEYIYNSDDSPNDIIWRPANRDIAFWNFYQQKKGKIDQTAAFELWNSSPINRPHACDGKVTTSEMAENLIFFAHSGKVTLREQMVGENGRMPDLPNVYPRLTLGYTVASPIYIAEKLKEAKLNYKPQPAAKEVAGNLFEVKEVYSYDKGDLWKGTVYPAADRDNWFTSATAAYFNLLKQMPDKIDAAFNYMRDELTELNHRLVYVSKKEGTLAPLNAKTVYGSYNHYQIPRIKGTYLLHQLRLMLGNKVFANVMKDVHSQHREKNITTEVFIDVAEKSSGKELKNFVMQWLERDNLPLIKVEASVAQNGDQFNVVLKVKQESTPYRFFTTVAIETDKEPIVKILEITEADQKFEFGFKEKPAGLIFNYGNDIPVERKEYFTYQNFFDDFASALIVYGTTQQVEANHTIALRYQKMVADRFTEVFQPIKKESEVTDKELAENDLIILGGISDNELTKRIFEKLGLKGGKYYFEWLGNLYARSDDGLYVTFANPFSAESGKPAKAVYLFIANSAQQLYQMTKRHLTLPGWALFKSEKIVKKGYHQEEVFSIKFN